MMAISLWQPWANLWIDGIKTFETRHWSTNHRGPLAVHAAQRLVTDIDDQLAAILVDQYGANWSSTLPRGALLGYGSRLECHHVERLGLRLTRQEAAQGNFSAGRYAWELHDKTKLARPIPYKGRQGLFRVPDLACLEELPAVELLKTNPQGMLV